ncbi:MAG: aconitase X catalytic domain-containing protein [Ardenticatenaceae bacterium]|nr:aconitase X catalytic domain-containing protein [Ardenticatenaceae bacterium]
MKLSREEQAMLAGERGTAVQIAMRILTTMGRVFGARRLIPIESAHIDGCLYHGDSGIDFAQKLVDGGAKTVVPTTLNVGAIDLLHPEHFQGTAVQAQKATRLMQLYQQMGCSPIWTCAPYQVEQRPLTGQQIAWAESNAIVFANSVLGACTNRYGDFIDICAAITGRAPEYGLHLPENRRGQIVFHLHNIPDRLRHADVLYPVLGYLIGSRAANKIPVITGLPASSSEDQLKALGAAAASSGAVALFHAVGITPEAPTLDTALHGRPPEAEITVTVDDLKAMRGHLSTVADGPIDVVALGSPHFSLAEFEQLLPILRQFPPAIEFIVCTHRLVLAALQKRGWLSELKELGVAVVVDTCVVVTPIVRARGGTLMTNSGKFAHYTPGNIGFSVIFGSLEECVRSAAQGQVWRDEGLWEN